MKQLLILALSFVCFSSFAQQGRMQEKLEKVNNLKKWRQQELTQYGMTMHGIRENGDFKWL